MKPRPEVIGEKVELLGLYSKVSPEEMESARVQALKHFEAVAGETAEAATPDVVSFRPVRKSQWIAVATIAAAVVLAVLVPTQVLQSAPAVLSDANGTRKVQYGEIVRPIGDMGARLAMADGSRVELRSESELSIERVDNGDTRILLSRGGVIVDAAAQRDGKLYVQTKDMVAAVSGTVSLVKAEEQGSRVAAIGGEVLVQQGTTERKLRPGEQATSNPNMESLLVKEELGWSREAVTHMASLQQAATSPAAQSSRGQRVAFDVVAIRPSAPAGPAAPGARGGDGGNTGSIRGCVPGSSGYSHQLDPRRLAITRATLFQLIGYAYPIPVPDSIWKQYPGPDLCLLVSRMGNLVGGPDWIKTDLWNIEAGIPEGAFSTRPTLTEPKLQQMLQTLLENRFKLGIHRETREMPVYLLKVGRNGEKFNGPRPVAAPTPLQPEQKPRVMISRGPDGATTRTVQSQDGTFAGGPPANGLGLQIGAVSRAQEGAIAGGPPSRDGISRLDATKISIADWINHLFANLDGRPVIDRTGLTGKYDFHFDYRGPTMADVAANPAQFEGLGQTVNREAVKAMGFELEESRAPVEVWVIGRAEKPTGN